MGPTTPRTEPGAAIVPEDTTPKHGSSRTSPRWTCDLGQQRIQERNPRIKVPERVIRTLGLAGHGETDLVFWGMKVERHGDQSRHYPVLSGTRDPLKRYKGYKYLGHTTLGRDNIVRISKRFFDDFDGHGFPVPPEARMRYGEKRTFLVTSESFDSDWKFAYLLSDADIKERFAELPLI